MTKRRNKTMGIHFNDEQREAIEKRAKASGARSTGAYIKTVLFEAKEPRGCHVQVADPELIRHLVWVGHSLSHISRVVNLTDEVNEVTAIRLYSTLAVMAEALEKIQEDNTP